MSKKVRLALPAVTNVQKGTSRPLPSRMSKKIRPAPCRQECPKRYVPPPAVKNVQKGTSRPLPSRMSKKVRPAPCRQECPKRYVPPPAVKNVQKGTSRPCRQECPKRYVPPPAVKNVQKDTSRLSYRHECPKRYVSSCRADAVCLWVWGLCWASSRPVGGRRHALATVGLPASVAGTLRPRYLDDVVSVTGVLT